MFEIVGKYNRATVYAGMIDPESYAQILRMCNNEALRESKLRMMPDTHAASGCTVGTSMTYADSLNPSYVGDDIGCGMQVYRLEEREMDFGKLDAFIRENIPSGPRIHERKVKGGGDIPLKSLHCYETMRADTVFRSFGTLGGGNHFIEVDREADDSLALVIHSGSRRLGRDVALAHEIRAFFAAAGIDPVEAMRKKMRPSELKVPFTMKSCFLSGALLTDYLADMQIAVEYAKESRKWMGEAILAGLSLHVKDSFTTIHNYIDTGSRVLRKGAVSAKKGERLLIPINMKDGSLFCLGKGNPDWNETAPHGAGRVMKRSDAKATLSMEEYKREMEGIYSTSVSLSTLDESPMAYRRVEEILAELEPTAEVCDVWRPVYNFKASRPGENEETADGED